MRPVEIEDADRVRITPRLIASNFLVTLEGAAELLRGRWRRPHCWSHWYVPP